MTLSLKMSRVDCGGSNLEWNFKKCKMHHTKSYPGSQYVQSVDIHTHGQTYRQKEHYHFSLKDVQIHVWKLYL